MNSATIFDSEILNAIECVLDRLLTPSFETPAAGLDRIYEAVRYSALAGGKRLRPYLVVSTADIFDVPRDYSLRAGCAIELIHCYSLIHDDLPAMDNSDLRRGRRTSHKAFDEATAILAGDGLLTEAFTVLADEQTHPEASIRTRLIRELAAAAGSAGMVGGQMIDILAERGEEQAEDIELLQGLKTGALIRVSARFGAYLADAAEETVTAIDRYAARLGLAFQITDDILDVVGSEEHTGKPIGIDAKNLKPTFVDLLGEAGARQKAQDLIESAKAELAPFGKKAEPLARIADFILVRYS